MPLYHQPGCGKSTASWPTSCYGTRVSSSTAAKPGCGTRRAHCPGINHLGTDVWVGNQSLPCHEQGLTILGTPVGSEAYIRHQLQLTSQSHQQLLQRIPALDDLQASWLLLLFCASPRSNHILRTVAPELVNDFVGTHDAAVASCLQQLLGNPDLPATALATAHLPLAQGGLGLQSAAVVAPAAHWASWAGTLPVLARQLPEFTAMLLGHLARPHGAPPHVHAALETVQALQASGWHRPTWQELVHDTQPPHPPAAFLEGPVARGWQHTAANAIQTHCRNQLLTALNPASQALLFSQSGPHASRAFTTIPYSSDFAYPSHVFRVLLLRRLRLPLPLAERTCRCRRTLDLLGDHRAACAQSGVLRARGGALERAAARVCREAGARVTTHTLLADLNVPAVDRLDNRRNRSDRQWAAFTPRGPTGG